MECELTLTLVLDVAAIVLALFCGWRGARPPDFSRGPRLVPWRMLMMLTAAIAVLLSAHVVFLVRPGS